VQSTMWECRFVPAPIAFNAEQLPRREAFFK
jgi:hypothetical protein